MENSIFLQTQGIKGGNTKSQKVGYILVLPRENAMITIDAFEGQGLSYKPREQKKILIAADGKNIFEGTFDELIEKLSK
jgi:hypothetical protein